MNNKFSMAIFQSAPANFFSALIKNKPNAYTPTLRSLEHEPLNDSNNMRAVIFLAVGSFALGLDAYVMAGLLPDISYDLNVSLPLAGQLITVFMLCYGLLSPVFATALSGRKAGSILGIALFVFAAANLLSALSGSFVLLFISRILAGIGAGIYAPFASATAACLVPSHKKGRALGIVIGGMSAGTVLGVPIGLLLASHFNWRATFLFVAFMGLIAFLAQIFWLPSVKPAAPPSLKARLGVFKNKHLMSVILVSTLATTAGLGLYTYLPIIIASLGVKHYTISYLLSWGIGGMMGAFLSGQVLDKFKNPFTMVIVILVSIMFAMLTFSVFASYPLVAMFTLMMWGAGGWGMQVPQQHELLSASSGQGAVALALAGSARYLGAAVGSIGAGIALSLGLEPRFLPMASCAIILLSLSVHIKLVGSYSRSMKVQQKG